MQDQTDGIIYTVTLEQGAVNGIIPEQIILYLDEEGYCHYIRGGWQTEDEARNYAEDTLFAEDEDVSFMEYKQFRNSFVLSLFLK